MYSGLRGKQAMNDLSEKPNSRIDYVDVCKCFAIVFIYFGHWTTKNNNLAVFAYSFHLQLFFIISGFFVLNHEKQNAFVFIKGQLYRIFIPFIFFTVINIIYFNLDGDKGPYEIFLNFVTNFSDFSHNVSPELWFLPALLMVSVFYHILMKLLKNRIFILLSSCILYVAATTYADTPWGLMILPFRKSKFLGFIGQNTIVLLGFEFVAKNFLTLSFIPMFNLGIVTLDGTSQVMTISILTILCIVPLIKPLNKYVPYLIGKKSRLVELF
jgi:fucose 4-O-acetylase-like acetyltransferase